MSSIKVGFCAMAKKYFDRYCGKKVKTVAKMAKTAKSGKN